MTQRLYRCAQLLESRVYNHPPPLDSHVYCQGKLLHDVQMARIYKDSKTFVDKRLLYPSETILKKYDDLLTTFENQTPPHDVLKQFVEENFEDGNELEPWTPNDWTQSPSFLNNIKDEGLKEWASSLNSLWKHLSRRIADDVVMNPDRYSIIYVPNGFVIPGGRFKEIYYWDTNWIVNGLLVSDMYQTAKGVIDNLLHLLRTMGHIPNGSRIYYRQRTQPPLVTFMMENYLKYTADFDFIRSNIELLDKEMDHWINCKQIELTKNGQVHKMYRYYAPSEGPRPESYREDIETTRDARDEDERAQIYTALKSGAESGWDFSSRWFIKDGTNKGGISNIRTHGILPVDLNAIMHKNFKILLEWYKEIGNEEKVNKYQSLSDNLMIAIHEVLWNEEEGIWLDYDLWNETPRKYYYLSNFTPFWTQSHMFTPDEATQIAKNYIEKGKLRDYTGGIPTSLEHSGEQWDYPNAWPPLQAFLIQGLRNIGTPETAQMAFHFASRYIQSNYKGFRELGVMFEKYDSLLSGRTGGGGEYEGQSGFGWTNGVALELLNEYGLELTTS